MTHGGGMTWLPPTYDPEVNLLYVPTGNPNPVFAPQSRKGDNLFTCSLVALNPDNGNTGLLYVGTSQAYGMQYLTDTDERPEGYGGAGGRESFLKAIDYRTGNVRWRHTVNQGGLSLLGTAGDLLFGGDGAWNFVAYDPATGDPLWHAGLLADPSNAPITLMVDGRQFLVVGASDCLYAFMLAR